MKQTTRPRDLDGVKPRLFPWPPSNNKVGQNNRFPARPGSRRIASADHDSCFSCRPYCFDFVSAISDLWATADKRMFSWYEWGPNKVLDIARCNQKAMFQGFYRLDQYGWFCIKTSRRSVFKLSIWTWDKMAGTLLPYNLHFYLTTIKQENLEETKFAPNRDVDNPEV